MYITFSFFLKKIKKIKIFLEKKKEFGKWCRKTILGSKWTGHMA
jgi:hypothetical protein